MDDPIKVIHKYKNNNKRIQYNVHIFLGDIVDENCMRVLKKIKELDLYNSLVNIDEKERNILEKNYGEFWYEKFFISYHIDNSIDIIKKINAKNKELKSIYGNEWYNKHIINYEKRIKTVSYNYEYSVKEERERKMVKKIIQKKQQETEEIIDYTTLGHKSFLDNSIYPTDMEIESDQENANRVKNEKDWCSDDSSSVDESSEDKDDTISDISEQTMSEQTDSDAESTELDSDEERILILDRKKSIKTIRR